MTDPIIWDPVRDFVYRVLGGHTTTIIAGTEAWAALDDDDPAKLAAVLIAGSRWCLEENIAEIHWQRGALKRAANAISESRDWKQVAKRIRDRDQFYRDNPGLKRKKVS